MGEEKRREKPEEPKAQPIDDQSISGIVGGSNPFLDLPNIENQQIDHRVTENG